MTLPSPYPVLALPAFEVDFAALFDSVQAYIRAARALRMQPPLVPNNEILIGQESLPQWTSAPAIYIVPRGVRAKSVRRNRNDIEPVPFFSQWLELECHCWGDDGPPGSSQAHSFSTTIELFRQLVCAFVEAATGGNQVLRGETHTIVEKTEFRQVTNVNRQGRMLVADILQETYLVRDPPVFVPGATPTTPGVQASVTVSQGTPPPGASEAAGTFLVPTGPNG